jgi:hypothetical protein
MSSSLKTLTRASDQSGEGKLAARVVSVLSFPHSRLRAAEISFALKGNLAPPPFCFAVAMPYEREGVALAQERFRRD